MSLLGSRRRRPVAAEAIPLRTRHHRVQRAKRRPGLAAVGAGHAIVLHLVAQEEEPDHAAMGVEQQGRIRRGVATVVEQYNLGAPSPPLIAAAFHHQVVPAQVARPVVAFLRKHEQVAAGRQQERRNAVVRPISRLGRPDGGRFKQLGRPQPARRAVNQAAQNQDHCGGQATRLHAILNEWNTADAAHPALKATAPVPRT